MREGEEVHAYLVNDRHQAVSGCLQLTLATVTGEALAAATHEATAPANAAARVATFSLSVAVGREREVFLSATFQPEEGPVVEDLLLLAEPKELALPDPQLSVVPGDAGPSLSGITVTAQSFAPYVWIYRADHEVLRGLEDNFFHLQPGESRTIRFDPVGGAAPETWCDVLCVRSLWGRTNWGRPDP